MNRPERLRTVMRWIMAAFYAIAGIVHLATPGSFPADRAGLGAVPARGHPRHRGLRAGRAAALLSVRLRWLAGVMLALYALCVWPANIKQALEHIVLPSIPDTWWYHGPRLAFQPVLIWWALFCAGVVDWPWRGRDRTRT